MRILQVNTIYGAKSTGRTCAELERAMTAMGHECYTAYGHGPRAESPFTYRINTAPEYYFHNLMSRLTGLEGYFSWFATRRLIRYTQVADPDVIHLRNLHGHYIHLPMFFRFLKRCGKPVVLHLHDCWIFTGKCAHYTERQCFAWRDGCGHCPALREYPVSWVFDHSSMMRRDKERWLTSLNNLTVIGVSDWVCDEARKSFLSGHEILRVYNWVDRDVFRPRLSGFPEQCGIDSSKFIIVSVSAAWSEGSARLTDALLLADLLDDSAQLVLVGHADKPIRHRRIHHVPFVESIDTLAEMYSAADIFVHLSTEDTFGKVIAEAMACGTPVIVYDSTACGEIPGSECGAVVNPHDVDEVNAAICRIRAAGKSKRGVACVNEVESRFDYSANVNSLIRVYRRMIWGDIEPNGCVVEGDPLGLTEQDGVDSHAPYQ